MSLAAALLLLAAAVSAAALLLGAYAFRRMFRMRPRSPEEVAALRAEEGEVPAVLLGRPWVIARVASPHGYELAVHALPGGAHALPGESPEGSPAGGRPGRLALFHHGIRWTWEASLKYAEAFAREGWTIVLLDARGHGESGGKGCSFGHFERDDLRAVADWALARWPSPGGFIAHGESLGAACVLQYAPLDPRLEAVIADCPFSSARAILSHRLARSFVPEPLRSLAVAACAFLVRRLEGFPLSAADPAAAILRSGIPVLLIHGREDDYVPWAMAERMAESRRALLPEAETGLLLVPGARHAASRKADPRAYDAAVLAFAERAHSLRRGSGGLPGPADQGPDPSA